MAERNGHIEGSWSNWKQNVGDVERWLSMASGALLVVSGLRQRGLGGYIKAATGALAVYRGLTGRCELYKALDIDTHHAKPAGKIADRKAEFTTLSA